MMEVVIPDIVVLPEFNFGDIHLLADELENSNGSYCRQLTQFMEEFIHGLRTKFRNTPGWEEYVDAHRDQFKCILEMIWYDKFDISDFKKKFLKLDEMKKDVQTKLGDFKRGMDNLPFWKKAVVHFVQSLEDTRDVTLGAMMWPGIKELSDLGRNLNISYQKMPITTQTKLLLQMQELLLLKDNAQYDHKGYMMRSILFHRQQQALTDNHNKWQELQTLREKVENIQKFWENWNNWFNEKIMTEVYYTYGLNYGVHCARFVLHMNNLDPMRIEAADVSQLLKGDPLTVRCNASFLMSWIIPNVLCEVFDIINT